MKFCGRCQKDFETEKNICPICKAPLIDIPNDENTETDETNEYEAAEIVSSMMTTGLL